MKTQEFEIILARRLSESANADALGDIADRLLEAGCDDQLTSTSGGVVTLAFHRDADTLGAAIDSAMRDVRKAGYTIERIVIDTAESVADVA